MSPLAKCESEKLTDDRPKVFAFQLNNIKTHFQPAGGEVKTHPVMAACPLGKVSTPPS
jgi:hypothetical protein